MKWHFSSAITFETCQRKRLGHVSSLSFLKASTNPHIFWSCLCVSLRVCVSSDSQECDVVVTNKTQQQARATKETPTRKKFPACEAKSVTLYTQCLARRKLVTMTFAQVPWDGQGQRLERIFLEIRLCELTKGC